MFRSRGPRGPAPLDQVLQDLPAEYHAVEVDDGRVVVGPTGAFVVAEAGRDVRSAARRLARVAERCRAVLADRLAWAPFVDPLIVTDRRPPGDVAASVVSHHMVRETLLRGPRLLSGERVARIADVIADARDQLRAGV